MFTVNYICSAIEYRLKLIHELLLCIVSTNWIYIDYNLHAILIKIGQEFIIPIYLRVIITQLKDQQFLLILYSMNIFKLKSEE